MRKSLIIAGLIACCGLTIYDAGAAPGSPESSSVQAAVPTVPRIDVYYCHRTTRCHACLAMEDLAKRTVEQRFAGEVAADRIVWHVVNIDEPSNKHFEQDYKLEFSSLIVSETKSGKETRWKNLEKIWDLYEDGEKFMQYVENEIKVYLAP